MPQDAHETRDVTRAHRGTSHSLLPQSFVTVICHSHLSQSFVTVFGAFFCAAGSRAPSGVVEVVSVSYAYNILYSCESRCLVMRVAMSCDATGDVLSCCVTSHAILSHALLSHALWCIVSRILLRCTLVSRFFW